MRSSNFKVDPNWPYRFVLITRGFAEEFGLKMSRNAWVLYLALATFYNRFHERAFPTLEMIEAVCPLSRWSRSRALRELLDLGLVEVWGEVLKRRRRTFYRLLHVNAKGWHMAERQQRTAEQLDELIAREQRPQGIEWAQRAYKKSRWAACLT